MALIDYTSYAEIRGVLGVALLELPDTVLSATTFWYALKQEFSAVNKNLLSDLDVAIANPTPTVEETDFIEAAMLFSTFAVSNQLLDSLPMFAPKSIVEGKSDVTRFSSSPYAQTIESVAKSYLRFKKTLAGAYSIYSGGAAASAVIAVPLIGSVSPTYDPVTGA